MKRLLTSFIVILLLAGAFGYWITRPQPMDPATIAGITGDADAGRRIFLAAGCGSCHADRESESQTAPLLSGGRRLATQFGSFVAPNISPDPTHGIGSYSLADFASVLLRGVSPEGTHLYPVMPYQAYARMTLQDIANLKSYIDTLPPDSTPSQPQDASFPYSLRPLIGIWKYRSMDTAYVAAAPSEQIEHGRYLVETLGHCAECHTPRDRFGGLLRDRWMAGAPNPIGRGDVPNITPAALDWSRAQIAYYLETGFNPSHQEVGRDMASVVANLAQLPQEDRDAIAAYLAGLAPVE